MDDSVLTLGLGALAVILPLAVVEISDAYRYRQQPSESVAWQLKAWGSVVLAWVLTVVSVAAWM